MDTCKKQFFRILIISAFTWSIVPLLRQSLPMDTQEAIIWGKYCLWGTTKHPPLSGWIAYGVYQLFGQHDFALYFLSQLFSVLGIIGIYKLAKCFLPSKQAVLAAAFQLGIILYHFSATEFNVNVVSLAVWPWCTYCFWKAYQFNKLKHWILFGILMGVNILNKYVGGLLAVALSVFVLITPQARKSLIKNPKAYFSVLVCLIVCAPHILWLYQHNFEMLSYIATRNPVGKITSFWRHLVYPLKFLSAQILFILPAVVTFFLFTKKQSRDQITQDKQISRFLLCVGIIPTLFWVTKAAIFGTPLKSMWNFPSLFVCGITAFYFVRIEWTEQRAKRFINMMLCWSILLAFGYAMQCLMTTSIRFQSDCKKVTASVIEAYRQENPSQPLRYVAGNIWFSDMISLYSTPTLKPVIWLDIQSNPWFDKTDFEQSGALVVAENIQEYEVYRQKVGDKLTLPKQLDIMYSNYFAKKKIQPVYWGVYQGEKNEK